ncbi:MAG TPA: DUF2726 domain-containing protein [Rubrivivax sp.]|nr:DUF2726 domain-containing protein [Rubrivivax sp.]
MQTTQIWIIALAAAVLVPPAGFVIARWLQRRREPPLPTEWALSGRPVFTSDERKVYRHLREALPQHIVLAKLPLLRFSQADDPQRVRYWYELLGGILVTYAVCSANGRVLLALDLDTDRSSGSGRSQQIKENVLAACKVRYLRIPVAQLPSAQELQLLLPQPTAASRTPHPAATAAATHGEGADANGLRRDSRTLWQDSGFFQDSFFGGELRPEGAGDPQGRGDPARGANRGHDPRPPDGGDPGDTAAAQRPPRR